MDLAGRNPLRPAGSASAWPLIIPRLLDEERRTGRPLDADRTRWRRTGRLDRLGPVQNRRGFSALTTIERAGGDSSPRRSLRWFSDLLWPWPGVYGVRQISPVFMVFSAISAISAVVSGSAISAIMQPPCKIA